MSTRELAECFGVSPEAVRIWFKKDDWPFGKVPPFDVAKVRAWRAAHMAGVTVQGPRKADPEEREYPLVADTGDAALNDILRMMPPAKQAVVRKEIERGKAVYLQNLTAEGGLVDRHEVERGWAARVLAVREGLLSLPRQVASECVGRSKAEIEKVILVAVERLLRRYAEE